MSLSNKLKRLKAHLGVEETERRTERKSLNAEDQTNRIDEHQSTDKNGSVTDNDGRCTSSVENKHAWTALGAKPYFYVDQHIWVREQRIPLSEYQGPYRLEELYEILARWNDSRISHPLSARTLEAEQLLFFDTETTGMGGGTGNSIFLLGYSQFSTDAVVVKQYALPFPDCEVALYQAFLDDLHADHHIVSYNGKAFDWPQVKTRHTLLRNLLPQLPSVAHFDLLHAARRLWKEDLPSCRLQMIEEQILGITREEDTPGYLIPMLYFEYLKKQDPMILEGVLEHHRQDVLTLISLYVHLSKLLLDWDVSPSPNESYHIAKWYNQLGEKELALEHYHRVIHRESRWKPARPVPNGSNL